MAILRWLNRRVFRYRWLWLSDFVWDHEPPERWGKFWEKLKEGETSRRGK